MVADEDISLDDASPDELGRLKMNFVGWKHTIDNAHAMSREVTSFKPDILIHEALGGNAQLRKKQEIIQNLLIKDIPTYIRTGRHGGPLIRPIFYEESPNAIDHVAELINAAHLSPILRKMDVSEEQAELLGINAEAQSTRAGEFVSQPLWYMHDIPSHILGGLGNLLALDARESSLREATMIEDVSRISANALKKLDGNVRVMVCFGATHSQIARHFQRKGIDAKYGILDPVSKVITHRHVYGFTHRAIREGVSKGYISETNVANFALASLMAPAVGRRLNESMPGTTVDEKYREAVAIEQRVIDNNSDAIMDAWGKTHSGFRKTDRRLMKAARSFNDIVAKKVDEQME
jgi:hypothetical protein